MVTEIQKKTIFNVLKPYKPFKVWVFGSFARNEEKSDSDLDLLVNLGKRVDLLDFIGIEQELSKSLGVKVKPYVDQDIMPLMVNEE
jgi:uncharacterized protein